MVINNTINNKFALDGSPALRELEKIKNAIRGVSKEADGAQGEVGGIADEFGKIKSKKKMQEGAETAKRSVIEIGKASAQATSFIRKLGRSVVRIAWYRTLRMAFSNITKAIKEGTTNLYEWSRYYDKPYAQKVLNLGDSWAYLKNQIGAAMSSLLANVLNSFSGLIDKIAEAFTWVSKLFAFLSGGDSYYEAVRGNTTVADTFDNVSDNTSKATEKVKEFKRQLMGFDQINNIVPPGEDSGKSGSGSGSDDDSPAYSFVKKQLGDFGQNSSLLLTIKDTLFTWKDLNAEQIAEKIVVGANALIGLVAGTLMFKSLGGGMIGLTVGAIAGFLIAKNTFNHDGKLSGLEVAKLICEAVFGVIGGVLGYTITHNATGAMIGFTLGATVASYVAPMVFQGTEDGAMSVADMLRAIISAGTGIGLGILATVLTGGNVVAGMVAFTIGSTIGAKIASTIEFDEGKENTSFKEWLSAFTSNASEKVANFKLKIKTIHENGNNGDVSKIVDFFKSTKERIVKVSIKAKNTAKDLWKSFKNHWAKVKDKTLHMWIRTKNNVKDTWNSWKTAWSNLKKKTLHFSLGISTTVTELWTKLKEKFAGKSLKIKVTWQPVVTDNEKKIAKQLFGWVKMPKLSFAAGGAYGINTGEMFIAREAGPEMVGRIGSKNAVVNNQQIVDSVSQGVYEAMMRAGGNNTTVVIEGDAKKMFKVIQKESRHYAAATGQPAF